MTDVVVVGAGLAGLCAAYEAAVGGGSVLVLEKQSAPGGNTAISDGGIAVPGSPQQKRAGIEDTPEALARDMLVAGQGLNHPELVRTIAGQALEAYRWTCDTLGMAWMDRVDTFGGHSVPRCLTPQGRSGMAFIRELVPVVQACGARIATHVRATRIALGDGGLVRGIEIVSPSGGSGRSDPSPDFIPCRAVVFATGGFAADIPFRMAQDPRLDATMDTTCKASSTAEGLKLLLAAGGNPVQLSRIQLGPWACPDEKGYGLGPLFGDYVVPVAGILVDPATGTRFVNEFSDRMRLSDAILERGHPVLGLADAAAVRQCGWDLTALITRGIVRTYDRVDAIEAAYGLPDGSLQETLDQHNRSVLAGEPDPFGGATSTRRIALAEPPFHVMRMWPKVHHTMGGVQIDATARVLDRNQQHIDGLFAAGEVTGGVHGACRLGSCALTEALVMGRIAGRQALQHARGGCVAPV